MLIYEPPVSFDATGGADHTCRARGGGNGPAATSPVVLDPCPTTAQLRGMFGNELPKRRCFQRGADNAFGFWPSAPSSSPQAPIDASEEPLWVQKRMRPNRRRPAVECKRRGAIVAFAAGYDFKLLSHFPNSFATVASPCDELIIITTDAKPLDLWSPHAAASDNVRVVPYEEILSQAPRDEWRYNISGLRPEGFRVLVLHAFVESYDTVKRYDYVMTLDTRDLVFNNDPFAFLRKQRIDGLFMTREVHRYGKVDGFNFNRWWTGQIVPAAAEKYLAEFKLRLVDDADTNGDSMELPVFCSGLYGGTAKAFRDFLRVFACDYAALRTEHPAALKTGGIDQGVFIASLVYSVRLARYPHRIYAFDEQSGPFRHWAYPEETLAINAETRLVNCRGEPYAVVHQADRYDVVNWALLRGFPGDRVRPALHPACGSVMRNAAVMPTPPIEPKPFVEWIPDATAERRNPTPYEAPASLDDRVDVVNSFGSDDANDAYSCRRVNVLGAFLAPIDSDDAISKGPGDARAKQLASVVGVWLRSFATLHLSPCERVAIFVNDATLRAAIERIINGTDGPETVPAGQPAPDAADRLARWSRVIVRPTNVDGAWTFPLPESVISSALLARDPPAPGQLFVDAVKAATAHTVATAKDAGVGTLGGVAVMGVGLGRSWALFLRNVFAAADAASARLPNKDTPPTFITYSAVQRGSFFAITPAASAEAAGDRPLADAARFAVATATHEALADDSAAGERYPAGCATGNFTAAYAALKAHQERGELLRAPLRPEEGPDPVVSVLIDRVDSPLHLRAWIDSAYSYGPFHTPSPMSTKLKRCPTPEEVEALLHTTTAAPSKPASKP